MIAVTRIMDARHHPFDVLSGSALGIGTSFVGWYHYFPEGVRGLRKRMGQENDEEEEEGEGGLYLSDGDDPQSSSGGDGNDVINAGALDSTTTKRTGRTGDEEEQGMGNATGP